MHERIESTRRKKKHNWYYFVMFMVLLLALLGGVGIGFQNASAFFEVLVGSFFLANAHALIIAIVVGGICSAVVNFFLNADLLEEFYKRVVEKPFPSLSRKATVGYVVGILVFLVTGVLWGMTAFSIVGAGGLSALGWSGILMIAVGIFVSVITIFQELETWLASFDNPIATEIHMKVQELNLEKDSEVVSVLDELLENLAVLQKEQQEEKVLQALIDKNAEIQRQLTQLKTDFSSQSLNRQAVIKKLQEFQVNAETTQPSITDKFNNWLEKFKASPVAYSTGLLISVGNVMALCLLFTIGLTGFLVFVGVPALPALIAGFSAGFTAGAFTQFYFYQGFLTSFCDKISHKLKDLFYSTNDATKDKLEKKQIDVKDVANGVVGSVMVLANGTVNAVLAYFGVQVLQTLFAAAGVVILPLMPLAIVSAVFAGLASVLLGANFWIRNAEKLPGRFAEWIGLESKKNSTEDSEETKALLSGYDEKVDKEAVNAGTQLFADSDPNVEKGQSSKPFSFCNLC